jgi:ABC-2 type transport system ATP-binding protein
VVTGLAREGATVFLTTQYLDEADRLADRVAVIDAGRLVAHGSAAELKAQVAGQRLDLRLVDLATYEAVATELGVRAIHTDRSLLTVGIATDGDAAEVRALLDEVDPRRVRITRFALHEATLDDVFFALTGRPTGPLTATEWETADV